MTAMTSAERLLAALRHEPLDRVPISAHELVGWNPDLWENQLPSYTRLMDRIRAETDCLYLFGIGMTNLLAQEASETWEDDEAHWRKNTVHTPQGDLQAIWKRYPGVNTTWRVERLLKDDADIERYLSIPFELAPPDMDPFRKAQAHLGDRGLMLVSLADPICTIAELFRFQDFVERAFLDPDLIIRMLDAVAPRVYAFLDAILDAGAGPLIRIIGPEYVTAPYLPPELFRRYVVDYDRPMIDRIHARGCYARIHCHGRLRGVLDLLAEMEPDSLDPVEAPPSGDIPLAEVKERVGDRICLMGNIQVRDLETVSPDEIRRITREAMEAGKPGGGFVIMPTAAPINAELAPATERNYHAFIDAALEYGRY